MPYISPDDRKLLDPYIEKLCDKIVKEIGNSPKLMSEVYYRNFLELATDLISLSLGNDIVNNPIADLAREIFEVSNGEWFGHFDYTITMIIQKVPNRLYSDKLIEREMRYWIYAETVGAIVRVALQIDKEYDRNWVANSVIGVLFDIKDEYKRRVNSAYEAVQIEKSGDAYTIVPYRTELKIGNDEKGKYYYEIMRDFTQIKDNLKND